MGRSPTPLPATTPEHLTQPEFTVGGAYTSSSRDDSSGTQHHATDLTPCPVYSELSESPQWGLRLSGNKGLNVLP